MTLADLARLHRRRLHRRIRSRQHADQGRPAHGADHRRAPDDLALPDVDAVVVALKSRSIEAAQAVARSRAADSWLRARGAGHVLFKICSTFDSTDAGNIGPVTDALRADCRRRDRAGDAGLSGNRPHGLSGQSVRRRGAAERKPAEGSSAQPDARRQSRAGAGAAEPQQSRPGRPRDGARRVRTRCARGLPSSPARAFAPRSSTRCSIAISKPSARWRSIIALSVGASGIGLGLARGLVASGRVRERADAVSLGAPVGGPAACLAGSCSQATLAQIAGGRSSDAGAAARSRRAHRRQRRRRERARLGHGAPRPRVRS